MPRGSGDNLGRALLRAIADAAGGIVGRLKSYTAKGWHAQISKLTENPRGYEAAASVGLSVNRRTLMDWLAERREPTAENRRKIAEAYEVMAGRWPTSVERAQIEIAGTVKMGADERERGTGNTAALVVDGSVGDWSRIREAWESGEELNDDDIEEWFGEDVIEEDLGEGSEPWEFPGGSYTVSLS